MSTSTTDSFLGEARETRAEPTWLREMRATASKRVREEGLPTRKTEAWRFTPIAPITEHDYARVSPEIEIGKHIPEGVEVRSLATVLRDEPELVEEHLGRYTDDSHFAGINSALFEDGLFVRVPAGTASDGALHVRHLGAELPDATVSYPRILVLVEANASLRLVEQCVGRRQAPHLTNLVSEIVIGRNAKVAHIRIEADYGLHVARVEVHQERDSRYRSHVVTLGAKLLRLDIRAVLDGPGAECLLNGVYRVTGTELVDHHTVVEHAKPRCFSRQNYRGVLDGKGQAVFDGIVRVHRDAQKTEAHQENRNLLLSDSATVHTKPHLEIDNDDVICSHGATVGSLDEAQLFYLRTRGLSEEMARAVLTFAFMRSVVDEIDDTPVRDELLIRLREKLPHADLLEELL